MGTGGMAIQMDPVRVAAEARGVAVHPGDGAAHLIDHRSEIAARGFHVDEVRRDVMCAGIHEHFGSKAVMLGCPGPPSAAMQIYGDRSVRRGGEIQIELFLRRRTVGDAARRAQPIAGKVAVAGVAQQDLRHVRRVFDLCVGVVQLRLVHVQPDRLCGARRERLRLAAAHPFTAPDDSPGNQMPLRGERENQHRQDHQRAGCGHAAPVHAGVAAGESRHQHRQRARRVVGQHGREQEVVPRKLQRQDARRHQSRPDQRQHHMAECGIARRAVHPGAFLQFARQVLEEAAHDPHHQRQAERAVGEDHATAASWSGRAC